MSKLCFFCGRFMGKKGDNHQTGVFHSVCDECASKRRLDERLPELVLAIADLRMHNASMERGQTVGVLSAV